MIRKTRMNIQKQRREEEEGEEEGVVDGMLAKIAAVVGLAKTKMVVRMLKLTMVVRVALVVWREMREEVERVWKQGSEERGRYRRWL